MAASVAARRHHGPAQGLPASNIAAAIRVQSECATLLSTVLAVEGPCDKRTLMCGSFLRCVNSTGLVPIVYRHRGSDRLMDVIGAHGLSTVMAGLRPMSVKLRAQ